MIETTHKTKHSSCRKNLGRSGILITVFLVIGLSLYLFVIRPWQLRWGATDEEVERVMLGDEIIKRPTFNATRGMTINANPEDIWPWLMQIGFNRAGWYSYDLIDNRGRPSARSIIPELQHMEIGDTIHLGESGYMKVKVIEPYRSILWVSPGSSFSWEWGLYKIDEQQTRLITRLRVRYRWTLPGVIGAVLMDVGDFTMMRRCMLNIKKRAEGTLRSQAADSAQVVLWIVAFIGFIVSWIGVVVRERWLPSFIGVLTATAVLFFLLYQQPSIALGVFFNICILAVTLWVFWRRPKSI